VWSTLQVFVGEPRIRQNDWFKRVWAIVPYDPEGLKSLWDRDGSVRTAETFLDKSFQFRLEVPTLALSNWQRHFKDMLGHALPEHFETDGHTVYQVVREALKENAKTDQKPRSFMPPTPREMTLILNQIGVLH